MPDRATKKPVPANEYVYQGRAYSYTRGATLIPDFAAEPFAKRQYASGN